MTRQEIINEICKIVRESYRGEVSMHNLGVEYGKYPIVAQYGSIKIFVSTLRHSKLYLSVYGRYGGKDMGADWADYEDIPTNTIKEIYSILKKKK